MLININCVHVVFKCFSLRCYQRRGTRVAKKRGPEGPGNSNNAPIGQGEYRYLREREVTSCQASLSSCLHNCKVHGLSVLGNTSQRLYSSDY